MAELARGTVFDRPWGRTLAALGLRGLSGQLTLVADGRQYEIAFSNGAVVAATSPIASDAAVRVALTGGLVSTTQVAELARKQAAAPGRDEVDVIAEHLRLGVDQALRLRRRTIAQRAARTFAVDKGDFFVTDAITLPIATGSELDIRTIIYLGAKQNLSEARLAAELGLFGTWFRLKPESFEDLPQYGFTDAERPILEHLMNGASLGDLEEIAGIDVRAVRAAVYALCAANACNVEQTRGQGATKPPPMTKTDPGIRRTTGSQPPITNPTPAAPQSPRTRAPSQQPVVAYRPGMRSGSKSQPPPNTTATPVRSNQPTNMPATARTSTRAQTSPGIDITPVPTRSTTPTSVPVTGTTPPAGTRTTTPPPNAPRATTPPSTARTSTPTTSPARTTTPTSVPATGTTTPAGTRTTTPTTSPTRTTHPALETPRSGSQPGVPRAGAGSNPGVAKPGSNPGVAKPGSGSGSGVKSASQSNSGVARAASGPAVSRTLTPTRVSGSRSHASIPPTTKKLPGPDEVKQLIDARVTLIEQGADHYALLGVTQQASGDEIRKSYFNIARQLHPDRLAAIGIADETHVAHKVFAQLNTAFSILSDQKRRAEYDQLLGRGGEAALRDEQSKAEAMAMRILQAEEAFKRGEMAMRRDDYTTAVAEFSKAVEGNSEEPDFIALHTWAVFCAASDKNTVARQTRATLEKTIQRAPRAIAPRFYLGRVLRMLGHDKEALDMFKDVLFDKPHHTEAQSEVRAIEARLATNAPPKGGGGLFGRKR